MRCNRCYVNISSSRLTFDECSNFVRLVAAILVWPHYLFTGEFKGEERPLLTSFYSDNVYPFPSIIRNCPINISRIVFWLVAYSRCHALLSTSCFSILLFTSQNLMSTARKLMSTSQNLISTSQIWCPFFSILIGRNHVGSKYQSVD
jgi:hypothetical protein